MLLVNCDSKYDFRDSYDGEIDLALDGVLYVDILNTSSSTRNIQLRVQTHFYGCGGYRLVYDFKKDGAEINLQIEGVDRPDEGCPTELAPAEESWDLLLAPGTYIWRIAANDQSDLFQVVVDEEKADLIQLDSTFTQGYHTHVDF